MWTMVGLAIWHFTIFLPDRFWGGIVGAFLGALLGSVIFGLLVSGLDVPGQADTNLATALLAVPGTVLGMGAVYLLGIRRESSRSS